MQSTFTTDALTWLQAVKDPCSCTPDSHTSKPPQTQIRRTLIHLLNCGGALIAPIPVINDLRHHAGFATPATANPVQPCCKLSRHEIGRLQPVIHALTWIATRDPEARALDTLRLDDLHDKTIRRIRADLVAAELRGISRSSEHEAFAKRFLGSKWLSGIPECNQASDAAGSEISHHQWKDQLASYDDQLWQAACPSIKPNGFLPKAPENSPLRHILENRDQFSGSAFHRLWTDLYLLLVAAERSAIVVSANPDLSILGLYINRPVRMIPPSNNAEDSPWNDLEDALHHAWNRPLQSPPDEPDQDIIFTDSDPKALSRLITQLGD